MTTFGNLQEFRPGEEGNIIAYIERVELYFRANDIVADKQVPVFLSVVGGRVYSLLRDLQAPDKPDSKTFKELAETLQAHYEPKPLVIAERFYFHSRSKKPGESVGEFVAEMRRLATNCKFGDYLSEALRDRLVCGLNNTATQCRLLTEANLTLAKAVELAQGMEVAEHNASKLKQGDSEQVHRMGPQRLSQGATSQKPCYCCGGTGHAASACKFREAVCHKCQKRGHIAKVCRGGHPASRQSRQRPGDTTNTVQEYAISPEEQVNDITLFTVDRSTTRKPIVIEMEVNGRQLPMELDTGAAVSLISTTTQLTLFPDIPLTPSKMVLIIYTGH